MRHETTGSGTRNYRELEHEVDGNRDTEVGDSHGTWDTERGAKCPNHHRNPARNSCSQTLLKKINNSGRDDALSFGGI